jgi:hypothetical protein
MWVRRAFDLLRMARGREVAATDCWLEFAAAVADLISVEGAALPSGIEAQ